MTGTPSSPPPPPMHAYSSPMHAYSFCDFLLITPNAQQPRMTAVAGGCYLDKNTGIRMVVFASCTSTTTEVNRLYQPAAQNTMCQLAEDRFRNARTEEQLHYAICDNTTDPTHVLFDPREPACAELWIPILQQHYASPTRKPEEEARDAEVRTQTPHDVTAAVNEPTGVFEPNVIHHARYTRVNSSTGQTEHLFYRYYLLHRPVDPTVGHTFVYASEVVATCPSVEIVANTWDVVRDRMLQAPQFVYVPPEQPCHLFVMDEWLACDGWTKTSGWRERKHAD